MTAKKAPPRSDFVKGLIKDGYLAEDFDLRLERPDEAKMADEALSIRLLAGFDVSTGITKNLRHNSPEEQMARAALARTIREKMSGFSGELLAMAIDPRTPSAWPDMKPIRKIRFENPGRASTLMRDKRVVDFIRRLRFNETEPNIPMDSYIQAAQTKFGLGRSRVHAIWSAHERMLKAAASTK